MVKTFELISELNNFAPMESSQSWDNSGWQVNFNSEDVKSYVGIDSYRGCC